MTVAEIIRRKYSSQDKRNEVKVLLREKLKISESHFFKKLNGTSPLTLKQAKITSEILKVSISKFTPLVVVFFAITSCSTHTERNIKSLEKEKLELEVRKLKHEAFEKEILKSHFIIY